MATVGVVDVVNLVKDNRIHAIHRQERSGADGLRCRASLEEEIA